jgi:hypothetical protein
MPQVGQVRLMEQKALSQVASVGLEGDVTMAAGAGDSTIGHWLEPDHLGIDAPLRSWVSESS